MKVKTSKLLVTIATMLIVLPFLATTAFAAADVSGIISGMEQGGTVDTSAITSLGANILTILQVAGIVIGTIILAVLGIKYMTGSLEEKAEYKKTMIPYVVGAVIVFLAPSLAKGIFTMVQNLNV